MKMHFFKLGFLLSLTLISHSSLQPSAPAAYGDAGGGTAVSAAIVNDEALISTLTDFADIAFKNKQEFCAPDIIKQDASFLNPPLLSHEIVTRALNEYLEKSQAEIQNEDDWHTQLYEEVDLATLTTRPTIKPITEHGQYYSILDQNTTDILPFAQKQDIENNEKVIYLGDLHGSMHSLLRNLLHMADTKKLIDNNFKLAPGVKLVMLGDMTDRGCYGIEVIYLLLKLKLQNWNNVFLLRGNHENAGITTQYGFNHELIAKYSTKPGEILYNLFLKFCRTLPLALFLENSGFVIQCCHGGIEPYYSPNDFLSSEKKYDSTSINIMDLKDAIAPTEYCNYLPGDGFQWSDFNGTYAKWNRNLLDFTWSFKADTHFAYIPSVNGWVINQARARGFNANPKDLEKYLIERPSIVKIIRGHQDQESCCKFLNDREDYPVEWCSIAPYIQLFGKTAPATSAVPFTFKVDEETRRQNRIRAATKGLNFSTMPDVITWTSAVEGQGCTSEGYGTVTFVPGGYENWTCTIYQNPTFKRSVGRGSAYGYVLAKPMNYDEYDSASSHEWKPDSTCAGVSNELKAILESGTTAAVVGGDAFTCATGGGSSAAERAVATTTSQALGASTCEPTD